MITVATKYSGNHKRIRHFMTKVNFLIQKVQDSMIDLIHLAGDEMPADVLTKPLGPTAHEKHTAHIMQGSINTLNLAALASCLSVTPFRTNITPNRKRKVHFPKVNPIKHVQKYNTYEAPSLITLYVIPKNRTRTGKHLHKLCM
jgi:hypothetical protein